MTRSEMPNSRGGRVVIWLMFATFVALGFGWVGGGAQIADANRLRASGVKAHGAITSITPGDFLNSPTAYYDFPIAGTKHYGYSHILAKDEHRLNVGSSVEVTYLPSDPSDNCVDLEGLVASGNQGIKITLIVEAILAAIFLPLIIWSRPQTSNGFRIKGQNLAGVVVLSIMGLGGGCALFLSAIPKLLHTEELISHGKRARAVITGVYDGEGSGRYAEYSFEVSGAFYHGKAGYVGGYWDKGPITITYLPSDPSFSALRPDANLNNARMSVLFLIGWLAIFGFFGVFPIVKAWRKGLNQ